MICQTTGKEEFSNQTTITRQVGNLFLDQLDSQHYLWPYEELSSILNRPTEGYRLHVFPQDAGQLEARQYSL